MITIKKEGRRDYQRRDRNDMDISKWNDPHGQSYGNNRDMNNDTYKLRRMVMDYIYRAKKLLGGDMPRVEVRIVDFSPEAVRRGVAGLGAMGGHIVWFSGKFLEVTLEDPKWKNYLQELVYHELLHALYAVPHIESSPLMSSRLSPKPIPPEEADAEFIKLARMYK